MPQHPTQQGPGIAPAEADVAEVAARIAELGSGTKTRAFKITPGSEWLMRRAMGNAELRTQLFRFVDALPAMEDDDDLHRHVEEYFGGDVLPRLVSGAVANSGRVPGGRRVVAAVARREVARMAKQFIVATDAPSTARELEALWRRGSAATVDLLGEHTHSHAEADRYAARLADLIAVLIDASRAWPANGLLEGDDLGALARVAVAIKPTALAPDFSSLTAEAGVSSAGRRLMPILEGAASDGAQVWFDLERYEVKHLTHRLARELLGRRELAGLQAGIVVQAYLRDSYEDLLALCEWGADRDVPLAIRLVKGAYWDTETVVAQAASWPVPVYENKAETDANYERCVRLLHSYHGRVRAGFGSHNLRSLAYAIAAGRAAGIPDHGYEVQLLWGMAEPVHEAFRRLGFRLRVYAPMGELVPGMAYLVRRLLENTSNESFVRLRFAEHMDLNSLVRAPVADLAAVPAGVLAPAVIGRPLTDAGRAEPLRSRAARPMVRARGTGTDERRPRGGARRARERHCRLDRRFRRRDQSDDRLGGPGRSRPGRRDLGLLRAGGRRPGGRDSRGGLPTLEPDRSRRAGRSAVPGGRLPAPAQARGRGPGGLRGGKVLGRRRWGRDRGDRLPRVLRPPSTAPRARRRGPVAAWRGQPPHLPRAWRGGRHLTLELPARDRRPA